MKGRSEIQEFYDDGHVFVTGGTGFIGKVLTEKLLRSTRIARIYLLIRTKRNAESQKRLDDIISDEIFAPLRAQCPGFEKKVTCISGDCSAPGLGLNIQDRKTLIENVNVVFHVAATVRFDEHLRLAYATNVNGTIDCLDLCRQMKHLKAFVHVSTAFSNCIHQKIEEKFYEYDVDYKEVRTLLERSSDQEIDMDTSKILRDWPNTYCFTKALTEAYIKDHAQDLPLGVYRPSIVAPTFKEPVRGWTNTMNGVTGGCVAVMMGFVHTIRCYPDVNLDMVPADMCVSGLIASAWDVAKRFAERSSDDNDATVPIYNYVSSAERPITWIEFLKVGLTEAMARPPSKGVWVIALTLTTNDVLDTFYKITMHYLPAALVDALYLMRGLKPRFSTTHKKIDKYMRITNYFTRNNWEFANSNVMRLWEKMSDKDRQLFQFSIGQLCWLTYIKAYSVGIKRYLLKEPVETPEAREVIKRRYRRLECAHVALKLVVYYVTFSCVRRLWDVTIDCFGVV